MISLCLATKNRPDHFREMWESALSTADHPDNIEVCSYHDFDDSSPYEYPPNHKEVFGPKDTTILVMMNEAQKVATGPIFMFIADDFIFETKGWDTEVLREFDKYPDKIVLLCPDGDCWGRWGYGSLGFVHKNWVDAVGYFIPPFRGAESADRWINEIAVNLGRRVVLKSSCIHLNERDDVHLSNHRRNRGWRGRYISKEMVERRKEDTEKLRKVMGMDKKQVNDVMYKHIMDGHRYPRWRGHAVMKLPTDLLLYHQVIYRNKPDFIIETGTKWGGSTFFLGDMCELVGHGQVISIDISPKVQPEHKRITYITASSIDRDIVQKIKDIVGDKTCMVILDSKHTENHVKWELFHYSKLVTKGQYIVIEDMYDGRQNPYGVTRARDWFVRRTKRFEVVDVANQFLVGVTRDGWLRRK